ncbi:MAG: LysR family transcriptional regulator [Bacteroidota bacterium]
MIEVRHLKLIDTIAKVGSLKKAAKKLFLTQSALSHQLTTEEVISSQEMEDGMQDLYKTAEGEGTFCYTFFKANAILE